MTTKKLVILLCTGLISTVASAQIVIQSDPHAANKSTHFISSGSYFKLGITANAGGAINSVLIASPGNVLPLKDIMGAQAETYGRLSQANLRDSSHNYVYNPTQAGFGETLGTPCNISDVNGKLTIAKHRMSLWNGDDRYDYIRNSGLGPNPYPANGSTYDVDKLDEVTLGMNQADEISSEFSFGGYYEDFKPKLTGLANPVGVILYHHSFDFNFVPGNCLKQFSAANGGLVEEQVTGNLVPVYQSAKANPQIVNSQPTGNYTTTDQDLSNIFARLTFTWDYAESGFDPKYRYFRNGSLPWTAPEDRYDKVSKNMVTTGTNQSAIIVSESGSNLGLGRTLGFYKPRSLTNINCVIGKSIANNAELYRDDRVYYRDIFEGRNRVAGKMSILGFSTRVNGLLNRNKLVSRNAYESLEQDYFFIYGNSPQQVKDAIDKLENYLASQGNGVASLNSNEKLKNDIQVNGPVSLNVFPNPATNQVTISSSSSNQTIKNIVVYNESGKQVFSKQNVNGNLSIPTVQLGGAGIYLVKTDIGTKKLIITQ